MTWSVPFAVIFDKRLILPHDFSTNLMEDAKFCMRGKILSCRRADGTSLQSFSS